jgi:hypothetical protein
MSDQTTPSLDHTRLAAAEQDYLDRCAESHLLNKKAVFDALSAAGLTAVIVHFDGYGDSGQIESIEAFAGEKPANLPAGDVEIAETFWGQAEISRTRGSLRDAIEALAYHLLSQTHRGWENNEGAYGDFTFDVETRTISLDYNKRYIETTSSQHDF